MCMRPRYIGFVDGEEGLADVDDDFREVTRQIYMIPGIGTHGVSCAGHFDDDAGYGRFWPRVWPHLGLVALPELAHVREILDIIDAEAQADPDAAIYVNDKLYTTLEKMKKYVPGFDFKDFVIEKTHYGLSVVKLRLQLGDNGALDSVPNHCHAPINLEGNQEVFERSKARSDQIKAFWKALEEKVKAFNQEHGFATVDFEKKEFLPFR